METQVSVKPQDETLSGWLCGPRSTRQCAWLAVGQAILAVSSVYMFGYGSVSLFLVFQAGLNFGMSVDEANK